MITNVSYPVISDCDQQIACFEEERLVETRSTLLEEHLCRKIVHKVTKNITQCNPDKTSVAEEHEIMIMIAVMEALREDINRPLYDTLVESFQKKQFHHSQVAQTKKNLFVPFCTATLGWNPPVWFSIKKTKTTFLSCTFDKELLVAIILLVIFVVDLADAVVDLYTSFKVSMYSTANGGDHVYGLLLGLMTISARLLTGWYGMKQLEIRSDARDAEIEETLISTYFLIELVVFMIEDGAAILLLANTYTEPNLLMKINTILTSTCGIGIVCYNIFSVPTLWDLLRTAQCPSCQIVITMLLCVTSLAFAAGMIMLLIQEVWGRELDFFVSCFEDEELSRQWTITYGAGVVSCILLASNVITSLSCFGNKTKYSLKNTGNFIV